MKKSKFLAGDNIQVNNFKGVVEKRRYDVDHGYEYTIKFQNNDLNNDGRRSVWFPEASLEAVGVTYNKCPNCNNPWTETQAPVSGEIWYDCLKCKLSKEEILKTVPINKTWEQGLDEFCSDPDDGWR